MPVQQVQENVQGAANNVVAHNHYENVDAVQQQQQQPIVLGVPAPANEPNVAQIINLQQHHRAPVPPPYHPYRNDVYDVPRNVHNSNVYANMPNGNQRRSNLHLEFNRPRCPTINPQMHQRSFDDTESCHYGSNYGYNMYERVGAREEPLYQNAGMYGRLDVIGHGIGRIERHLSSSCGSIDHYNVGGHYAVLSHSHVGQMVMNGTNNGTAGPSSQNSRDGVKSFFSCLGGESSQSLSNINGAESNGQAQSAPAAPSATVQRPTGAIPKTKSKPSNKVSPKPAQANNVVIPPIPPPMPTTTNNRISKSSLQYLLLNKWLPLGPDYKIIDFNFMFSRNCSSADQCENGEGVVQFNGQAEMVEPGIYQPQREYPTMNPTNYPRVIRNTPQLSRLRESEAENGQHENAQRADAFRGGNAFRARSESPSFNGPRGRNQQDDSFRNWSFNFENNSFKPAGAVGTREIRRITDGTLAPKDFQEQNPRKELPSIVVEQEASPQEPQPSTSKSTSPSTSESSGASSSSQSMKTSEMKKSENYENLASLQEDAPAQSAKQRKKKSTESQSSDSVTLAEEDEDAEDAFDELESDID